MWREVVRNKSGKASWIQTVGDLEWQAEEAGLAWVNNVSAARLVH